MPNYAQQTTEKPKKAARKLAKADKKIAKGFAAAAKGKEAKMERKFAKATKKTAKAREAGYGMKMKDKFGMGGKLAHDSNYELLDRQSN